MKDEIYYIKQPGDGSEDDVYLVHIDPAVFEGTSWIHPIFERHKGHSLFGKGKHEII